MAHMDGKTEGVRMTLCGGCTATCHVREFEAAVCHLTARILYNFI
jgi:hypothetical protein